eukprot:CAMPEP_0170268856 /NCGR_PEP_ID=MMETSP0116_2-20130129/34362_1 /TAXON_ID=400756 /ORGANISM="Durinskia baltica, Strain CSIRO CS-38" /LENGTH=225 /DNA_ID=CAMNT_0010520027 /DNA_START=8 /DNA_END=682 /DNA_ORIENTATION=-
MTFSLRLAGSDTVIPAPLQARVDSNAWAQFHRKIDSEVLAPLSKKLSTFNLLRLAAYAVGICGVIVAFAVPLREIIDEHLLGDDYVSDYDEGYYSEDAEDFKPTWLIIPFLFFGPVLFRVLLVRAIKGAIAEAKDGLTAACLEMRTPCPDLVFSVEETGGSTRCRGLAPVGHVRISVRPREAPEGPVEATVIQAVILDPDSQVVQASVIGVTSAFCTGCGARMAE